MSPKFFGGDDANASDALKRIRSAGPNMLDVTYSEDMFVYCLDEVIDVVYEAESLLMDCGPCNGGVTDDDCYVCGRLRKAIAALDEKLNHCRGMD